LGLLKTGGPQTAAELGKTLGVTAEAARQHLVKMAGEGLVAARSESHGVGRPTQRWNLTHLGNARFPDRHGELTVQILRAVRMELGQVALERLIDARAQEARTNYAAALEGSASLGERVARLAAIRSSEGYMAEWKADGAEYLLIENHCPICAAATECQGFCRSELELFAEALGLDVDIERSEHVVAGDRRCVYHISRKDGTGELRGRQPGRPAATTEVGNTVRSDSSSRQTRSKGSSKQQAAAVDPRRR
jgi:predicted ArsR family transcriptional regulator